MGKTCKNTFRSGFYIEMLFALRETMIREGEFPLAGNASAIYIEVDIAKSPDGDSVK